ncbi:MAG: cytochrome c3 family protein [Myxococcota bacterium]
MFISWWRWMVQTMEAGRMRRSPSWSGLVWCLLLIGLVGCSSLLGWRTAWDAGPEGIRFNHLFHLKAQGLSCQDCHSLDSEKARYAMPNHAQCLACHPQGNEQKPDERCQLCHVELPAPVQTSHLKLPLTAPSRYEQARFASGPVQFVHGKHTTQTCGACHAGIEKSSRAREEHLPVMPSCMGCHTGQEASADCKTCHPQLSVAVARQIEPVNKLFPHPADWEKRHGRSAVAQQESCRLCHEEQSCESCHQTRAPQDHAVPSWSSFSHGRQALLERERCATCHTQPSCERCHAVPPDSHTLGFMNPYDPAASPDAVQRHRLLAQRDTRSCLTCHTVAEDCSRCHLTTRR